MRKIFPYLKDCFIPHVGNNHEPHFLRRQSMLVLFLIIIITVQVGFLLNISTILNKESLLGSVLPAVLVIMTNED